MEEKKTQYKRRERISTTIYPKLAEACRQHGVKWSNALMIGARYELQRRGVEVNGGVIKFDNDKTYNELLEKVAVLTNKLETLSRKQYLFELQQKSCNGGTK